MRLLITGATGLIGSAIVKQAQERGHSIHYLTTTRGKITSAPGYKGFYWNPANNEIDFKCFEGVDTIIHLAGASIFQRWTEKNKEIILKSRTASAALLLDSLREINHDVTHLVSASAIGAYPSSLKTIYSEEDDEYHPGFLGQVVSAWEASADKFAEQDILVTKIRVGVVLAKDGGALPQIVKPIKLFVGAPLAGGAQWQSWIHVDDLAGIFLYAIAKKLAGIYNGVSPYPVTNETMTEEVAKILGRPIIIPNVPGFALKMLLGKMSSLVTESQKVSASKILMRGYAFQYPQLHEALLDLLK
ncbi:MAG: TIGR01777 family protein [Cytophagaceae bacterium]|nr:TIGR01777 family protein [Cytophagaceae bacterium]|tara:strand:+ start:3506 stop:4411 length:906 start_codon:yes stop_codon:yes gene_type:complete